VWPLPVQPLAQKYSDFQNSQITLYLLSSSSDKRGVAACSSKNLFGNLFNKPCANPMLHSKPVVRKLNIQAAALESLSRRANIIVTGAAMPS
jgi:hypothetical protein